MMRRMLGTAAICMALSAPSSKMIAQSSSTERTFAAPEDAIQALLQAARPGKMNDLLAIFGDAGRDLIASSDEATARENREIFVAAAAEGWRLVNQGADSRILIIGNEGWPFPVPLVKRDGAWRFDTAAGKEEVLARRIGRNELAVIGICRTYVAAQRRYAQQGHDGKPAELFATTFRSDPGTHDGLYWPAERHQPQSPLGDLLAQAALEGRQVGTGGDRPSPFHGYYFRILTRQGASAPGGAKSYLVNGNMSGGFALIAWPAAYDATGVMTFVVNQDGIVHEKDLGPQTDAAAAALKIYNPDRSWQPIQ